MFIESKGSKKRPIAKSSKLHNFPSRMSHDISLKAVKTQRPSTAENYRNRNIREAAHASNACSIDRYKDVPNVKLSPLENNSHRNEACQGINDSIFNQWCKENFPARPRLSDSARTDSFGIAQGWLQTEMVNNSILAIFSVLAHK
ncbi:unnamed protein product [Albugo candida]|uniref:Uncharacterized protein n=1 Tax=Albugo candida TaxID=65357 RepID=A0A024FST7_9STRA|nr:unnamed protein product [Albugo candida]|eukprot:CCI10068.1 unnamed protein product [Albugo candida]